MIEKICDTYGTVVGAYDGDSNRGKIYDANGNYLGEYWGGEIFNKNGMRVDNYNGFPEDALKTLILHSL